MNNPVSTCLRRPGEPAPVSLAYPSSHPGANTSLVSGLNTPGGVRAGGSYGGMERKPDWLEDWEEEWGDSDDWGAEIGHTLKLAVLAPVTTWKILGQAIMGAGDEIDFTCLEEDEEARRQERAVYRRQRRAQVIFYLLRTPGTWTSWSQLLADISLYSEHNRSKQTRVNRPVDDRLRCNHPEHRCTQTRLPRDHLGLILVSPWWAIDLPDPDDLQRRV